MNKKLLGVILMIGLLSGCNMTPQQWQAVGDVGDVFRETGRGY